MHVAVVTPRYPPVSTGGGERSTQLLATRLAASDRVDGVTVFSFDGSGETTDDGVTVERLGSVSPTVTELQNLRVLPKLRPRLSQFDVVHSYNMELHPTVGFLSDRLGVPSVATLNSYHFFPSSVTNTTATGVAKVYERIGLPTTGRVMRHYMGRIDAFVALSRAIQEIYERNGFADARFEHIPNMLDPAFETPDPDPDDDGRYGLLYVGSLTENKGVEHLVRAMARLPETYRVRIVGDGPERDRLEALAAELGVTDRVVFSGRIPYDEIGQAYADADLFVHPGIWPEPLNRTVMEAMQAGLPVVCTDIGGPPEIIPDEELLCAPGDSEDLARTIQHASDLDRDVGGNNRASLLSNHEPETIVDRIVDLYVDLCR